VSERIHYTSCPNCQGNSIENSFSTLDFTVSQEAFEIWECVGCTFKFTQNVPDEESIGPYYKSENYISHSDKKESMMDQLYHKARDFMLASKKRLVLRLHNSKTNGSLLDIGAGTGYFLKTMRDANWSVSGIEADEDARLFASNYTGTTVLPNSHLSDIASESHDIITMWHVLEHVHELDPYLEQIHSVLKSNGYFIVAIPNHTAREVSLYKENWAAWDVPRHLYHWNTESFSVLMQRSGFKIIERKSMPFDPFYIALLSEQYKTGKKNIFAALFNGISSLISGYADITKSSSVIYVMKKV